MKLYYSPGVCSLAPHIILRETNTPVTLVKTDIYATKTTEAGADYRATNPLGYVPALELDDGTVLTEVPAIVQFIADKAGATDLAPQNGTIGRYRVQSWLSYAGTELHRNFTPLFNAAMPEEAKAIFRDRLKSRFEHLEQHLKANDFVMGQRFTLADAYIWVVLSWTTDLGMDLSAYPSLQAYRDRIAARPAVQAALAAEGIAA